jgi:hypothetical protein
MQHVPAHQTPQPAHLAPLPPVSAAEATAPEVGQRIGRFVPSWYEFPGPPFRTTDAELEAFVFTPFTRPKGWWWERPEVVAILSSIHSPPGQLVAGRRTPIGAGGRDLAPPASGGGGAQPPSPPPFKMRFRLATLTSFQWRVLAAVLLMPGNVAYLELAQWMGHPSPETVWTALQALKAAGLLELEGAGWQIAGDDAAATGGGAEQC